MIAAASTDAWLSRTDLIEIVCFCTLLLVTGVRHYHGRGRWMLRWIPFEVSFFGIAWYGACGLMVVLCNAVRRFSVVLGALLAVPAFVLLGISLMSLFWLPPRLLPAWYLRWRAQGRPPSGLVA